MKICKTFAERICTRVISKTDIIDHDKQLELVIKAKAGNKKAQDQLIICNLRFILNIAIKYSTIHISVMDLVGEGVIGMIKSIENFDPYKNVYFLSYSIWWVRSFMKKYINDKENIVRLPPTVLDNIIKELKYIKNEYDMSYDTYEYMCMSKNKINIDDFVSMGNCKNNLLHWSDVIKDENSINPEQSVKKIDTTEVLVNKFLNKLSDTEKYVIKELFGINTKKNTLLGLSKELSTNIEMIRKIKKQAIKKIKQSGNFIYEKEIYEDFNDN